MYIPLSFPNSVSFSFSSFSFSRTFAYCDSFIILLTLFYHLYSIFILYFLDHYPFLFIFVYFHIASDPLTSKQSKKTLSKQKTILLKIFILLIFLSDYAILQT
jgi:hypothetical protein